MDRATATIIETGRIAPSVLLIHTPAGYRALVTGVSSASNSYEAVKPE